MVETKCYVLVFCCPATKLINLQVIEAKSDDGVIDGVNRLGGEVGFPSFLIIDLRPKLKKGGSKLSRSVLRRAALPISSFMQLVFRPLSS